MSIERARLVHEEAPPPRETPFYIPATGPSARVRRTLKHGDTFAVLDSHGDIGATADGPDGIFHNDTRFLSRLELLLNGMQPLLLGSTVRDDNSLLTVDLTNPDIFFDGRLVLPKDMLHMVRTVFLWRATAFTRITLRNHGDRSIDLRLSLTYDSDFADIFEVRGMRRVRRGHGERRVTGPASVEMSYTGLDAVTRTTSLHVEPVPFEMGATSCLYQLDLPPAGKASIFLTVSCERPGERPRPFYRSLLAAHREHRRSMRGIGTVETSNALFNEVLCRSMADLYMLMTATPQGPYPYAGTPWYSTTFGRDGILTALQMLWFDPSVAEGVLKRLAFYQARCYDPAADAEPGKILHEMRGGEMAALGEVPFGLYYGSVDSTPLFVMLAVLHAERTGDWELFDSLWPAVEAALVWIDGPGDPDGDGFVEYTRLNENGLVNQGWKDLVDAIFHADGQLAEGPIALAEVQGYVHAAKLLAARAARRLGFDQRAAALEAEAKRLAARFEKAFWCEDLAFYALALDGRKRPCRVRTSNAGQALFTGICRPDRAAAVGRALMTPKFFSGWGIRTVARDEGRYNPMSYHNGSIWPHDNALVGVGLSRYGLIGELQRLFAGLFEAATYMDLRRLPELFCGFPRQRGRGPTLYPVACAPQAWASATPFTLLRASLGLEFDPDDGAIRFRNPRLPPFLDRVLLRNLRLGDASVDLLLTRNASDVALQVLRKEGAVRVAAVYG